MQIGPCKAVFYRFVLGSTSAVTGDLSLTLPTNMAYTGAGFGAGYFESGAGRYDASVYAISMSGILLRAVAVAASWGSVAAAVSSTTPETWPTGDMINVGFLYVEA